MAKGIHTESTFEQAIESNLLENGGYVKGSSTDYDAQLGLFPSYITNFLKHSQPKAWDKIANIHKEDVEKKVILPYTITNCWPSDGGGVSWLPDNNSFIYLHYPIVDNKSDSFLKNMVSVVYKIGSDPKIIRPILSKKDYPELNLKEEDFPIVSINKNNHNYLIAKIGGVANFSDTYFADFSELNNKRISWKTLYKKEDKITTTLKIIKVFLS